MTRAAEHLIFSYSCGKRRPLNWAKIVDEYFNLQKAACALEPRIEEHDGFSVSMLVTDSDPPAFALSTAGADEADVPAVPRPRITDQHETAVTVTSLAVFGSCPRKYYIQRSLGWNSGRFRRFDPGEIDVGDTDATQDDEADGTLNAARVGSTVHEILANAMPALASEAALAQQEGGEARRLARVFLNSDLGKRAAAAPRKAREWAFVADIDGTIVRGTIDLWFEENGRLHLVDYKTDDVTAAASFARAREYTPQLALYALALERALGMRPAAAWLHFLRTDTVVEVPLDDLTIREARSLIARLRKAQDEIRFDLNEGEHCRTCQFYRSLCPAGGNRMKSQQGVHNENYA
jgi:ATP-dependent exoDNAse (exonuclease V) beta subunit